MAVASSWYFTSAITSSAGTRSQGRRGHRGHHALDVSHALRPLRVIADDAVHGVLDSRDAVHLLHEMALDDRLDAGVVGTREPRELVGVALEVMSM